MRVVALTLFALTTLTGCVALHANLPDDMVRHVARRDGVELGAVCSLDGRSFSEGAVACMAKQRMTCDPNGRWAKDGAC
jgi:hypothetical protein